MSSPDHTPEATEPAPGPPAAFVRQLREKAAAKYRGMRAAFTGTEPGNGPHRLPPGLRTAQLGAAAVATGVLGVVLGAPSPAPAHADPGPRPAPETAGHVQPGPVPPPSIRSGLGDVAKPGAAGEPFGLAKHGGPGARSGHGKPALPGKPGAPGVRAAAPPADPLDQWISQATDVLAKHGVPPDKIDREDLRTIIEHESGGDPSAANGWDSNAAAGTPSKGLMQTIDPTFHSYAVPGHQDIWNPVDNIVAGTRYSIERYGSVSDVPGVVGVGGGGSYRGY